MKTYLALSILSIASCAHSVAPSDSSVNDLVQYDRPQDLFATFDGQPINNLSEVIGAYEGVDYVRFLQTDAPPGVIEDGEGPSRIRIAQLGSNQILIFFRYNYFFDDGGYDPCTISATLVGGRLMIDPLVCPPVSLFPEFEFYGGEVLVDGPNIVIRHTGYYRSVDFIGDIDAGHTDVARSETGNPIYQVWFEGGFTGTRM